MKSYTALAALMKEAREYAQRGLIYKGFVSEITLLEFMEKSFQLGLDTLKEPVGKHQCCWEVDEKWKGPCAHCHKPNPLEEPVERKEIEWVGDDILATQEFTDFEASIHQNLISIGKLLERIANSLNK